MIRLARNDDMMELFTLANDEMARANSIHQDKISLDEHKAWFANKLKSKDAKIYILQKDKIIGVCRIEKEANSDFWVVSVIISKDFRGLGLGKKLLNYTILKNPKKRFKALIKACNEHSIALFKAFDFTLTNNIFLKNEEILVFIKDVR